MLFGKIKAVLPVLLALMLVFCGLPACLAADGEPPVVVPLVPPELTGNWWTLTGEPGVVSSGGGAFSGSFTQNNLPLE